jgi:Leucine-rich repeat (LRR) protein
MKRIIPLIFLAASVFSSYKSNGQANVTDSLALVDLYNSTNGAGWNNTWILTQPVSTWQGVGLDINGYNVISLVLELNNLSGPIPASLGNLQSLTTLELEGNKLTDTIPASLGTMPSLLRLLLSDNELTGRIPASLGSLSSLSTLELSYNQLSDTIPASLGSLKLNQAFDLSHNQLTGSIPPALGTYKDMAQMLLNNNLLTGTIPDSLGNLLYIGGINLSYNQLTGSIPPSFQNLEYVELIDLSNNQLSGTIPSQLGNLQYASLVFSNNQLTGSIPPALGNIIHAGELDLSYNQLTDTIPSSLGNLQSAYILYLNNNQLTGNIPASLEGMKNLDSLGLQYNQLTGSIPSALGDLIATSRITVNLSNNQLRDTVPASLEDLTFAYISLENNEFTFDGMEGFAQKFQLACDYAPQAYIPLYRNGSVLSVYAGGTLSNNTYRWYKGSTLAATITGDSTYTMTAPGDYSVAVTNAIATQLTLYSDSLDITSLPVSLVNFTAAKQNNQSTLLHWTTTDEVNSSYFEVNRSKDGTNFTTIGDVAAIGNSNAHNNYSFTDSKPNNGANYYRLKEVDKDGTYQYSPIRNIIDEIGFSASVYPNPATDKLNVQINAEQNETAQMEVISADGRILLSSSAAIAAGASTQTINVAQLSSGSYFVKVSTVEGETTVKFVKGE